MVRFQTTFKIVSHLWLVASIFILGACNLLTTSSGGGAGSSSGANSTAVISISTGYYHSCVLTAAGGVNCWGLNIFGQLGNGTTTQSNVGVQVSGMASGASSVVAGGYTSCAIITGALYCWGSNISGSFGNNSTTNSSTPVAASAPLNANITQVSIGHDHSCAVTSTNTAYCWGSNTYGQLGNNTNTSSLVGVQVLKNDGVTPMTGVTAISAGYETTCAVAGGAVFCWGNNAGGQIGNGATDVLTTHVVPSAVGIIAAGATAISVGNQIACAIVSGAVQCWGDNNQGEVGQNSVVTPNYTTPTATLILTSGVTALSISGSQSGGQSVCALMAGATYCWGYNSNGQVGNGSTTNVLQPTAIASLGTGATAISAGGFHSCGLLASSLLCWGAGSFGQLGNNTTSDSTTPTSVTNFY